ncbi:unnamed protein product [Rhodiola kirilowii]
MRGSADKVLKDLVEAKYRLTLGFEERMDSSSDEESEKGMDHEQTINSLLVEIEEMKQRLEESEKKCFSVEKLFELKQNDDGDLKLDEENRKVKEQLKWKMEQFKHLEEAHEKLKDEFQTCTKDWDVARSVLVDEVSTLKISLESQTRMSNDLQMKLEMCSQALAHEESKIKTLEAELAESKAFYEKSFAECQEVKLELENLMLRRDEEIANLKSYLAEKEAMCKEYVYTSRKIEQENQELLASIKELQEAQIQGASCASSSSTLARVKSKLKNVEQKHKAREAEWSCKLEKLADELNSCRYELEMKDATIKEISSKLDDLAKAHMYCSSDLKIKDDQLSFQHTKATKEYGNSMPELVAKDSIISELTKELEACRSSLMQMRVENEETSHMLLAYQEGFAELQMKMESEKEVMEKLNQEREERICNLMSLLDEAKSDLARVQGELLEERDKSVGKSGCLKFSEDQRVDLLAEVEKQQLMLMEISEKERHLTEQSLDMENDLKAQCDALQAELERHRAMVMEMSENERYLKEQCLEMEFELKKQMQEVCHALESARIELAEASCKESEIEFEMQSWKALAEQLQYSLAECQHMRKQVEHSLLAEVEFEEKLKQEMDSANLMLEEKERNISDLTKQIASLGLQIQARQADAELTLEGNGSFLHTAKEKDIILQDIQNEFESLQYDVRKEPEYSADKKSDFVPEKEDTIHFIQEKKRRIEHLMERLDSLEETFNNSLNSLSLELEEKDTQISWILEALEKIATAEKLAKLEIEEKEQMVAELEEEIHDIEQKLESREVSFCQMEKQALDIKDVLEAKQMEMIKLTSQMKKNLNDSDALINELRSEKMALYQDVMKLSTERENLMDYIGGVCNRINEFSNEDMQLMGMLGNMMHNFDDENPQLDLTGKEDNFNHLKENLNSNISPTIKKFEALPNERSPFREINSQLHLGASSQ